MCTLWIDGVTLKVQWQIFARRNMLKNGGRRMTFLGHTGNQATTPAVKEPRNRGKKSNRAFVPVTPLVLIGSQHPFLCGKLNLSNTCLRRVSWVVFSRSYWSICFLVFVCVCVDIVFACCPHLMVWFGLHYVTSRGSVHIRCIATNCPVGDRGPSAAGVS